MRKRLLVLCSLLLLAAVAWGSPMCTNNTLQYYVMNYGGSSGCALGSLTFSNFGFQSGGTVQPPTSSGGVNVSTVTGTNTGLSFDGPFGVAAGYSLDDLISFAITSPAPSITNDTLSMQGFGAVGSGSVQVAESLCIGAMYASDGSCSGTSQSLDVFANSTSQMQSATATFGATGMVDLVKNIIVQGGTSGTSSSAGVSVVFNTTSSGGGGFPGGGQVPEPDTLLSLGSGLVITSLLFRRKLRKS